MGILGDTVEDFDVVTEGYRTCDMVFISEDRCPDTFWPYFEGLHICKKSIWDFEHVHVCANCGEAIK